MTQIVAYPGSDFEEIQRKDEDRFNEYAKDLPGNGFVDIKDGRYVRKHDYFVKCTLQFCPTCKFVIEEL